LALRAAQPADEADSGRKSLRLSRPSRLIRRLVSPQVRDFSTMDDIESKYALLGLTDEARARLVQLGLMAKLPQEERRRIVIETVIVQDGDRTVVEREERSA
jgi:hypothetical protein